MRSLLVSIRAKWAAMSHRSHPMPKIKLCIDCRSVKPLDDIVGRCMAVKTGMQFCKLREPSHVCKKFKRIEEVLDGT